MRRLCLLAVMVFGASGVAHAQTTPDPANTNTANEGRVTFGVALVPAVRLRAARAGRLQRLRSHARLPRRHGPAVGPRESAVHHQRAADDRRQSRCQPDRASRIRVSRGGVDRPTRTFMFGMQPDALAHLRGIDRPLSGAGADVRRARGPDPRPERSWRRRSSTSDRASRCTVASTTAKATAAPRSTSSRACRAAAPSRCIRRRRESRVRVSGFYSYGWYAKDRPRNVGIAMASYESPHVVATAQYLVRNRQSVRGDRRRAPGPVVLWRSADGRDGMGGTRPRRSVQSRRLEGGRQHAPLHLRRRALEPAGARAHRISSPRSSRCSASATDRRRRAGCSCRRRWSSRDLANAYVRGGRSRYG